MSYGDLKRFEDVHSVRFPVNRTEWTWDVIERVQSLPAASRVFTVRSSERLHPICLWYTREDNLRSKVTATPNHQPDAARDALGLVHYEEATPVAVLYFRKRELTGGPDDRPTFTEAADNRRFKTLRVTYSSKSTPSWGRTTDPQKFAISQIVVDGCPERIAQHLPHRFELNFDVLGLTVNARGRDAASDSDYQYAQKLVACSAKRCTRTITEVEHRLRKILK